MKVMVSVKIIELARYVVKIGNYLRDDMRQVSLLVNMLSDGGWASVRRTASIQKFLNI